MKVQLHTITPGVPSHAPTPQTNRHVFPRRSQHHPHLLPLNPANHPELSHIGSETEHDAGIYRQPAGYIPTTRLVHRLTNLLPNRRWDRQISVSLSGHCLQSNTPARTDHGIAAFYTRCADTRNPQGLSHDRNVEELHMVRTQPHTNWPPLSIHPYSRNCETSRTGLFQLLYSRNHSWASGQLRGYHAGLHEGVRGLYC